MRKYLISDKGHFYKANLHCHTTVSDGDLTPGEIKELYKKEGYSIIAFTDHELLQDHSYLNDDDFLAITGYEISFCEEKEGPWKYKKNCHINCYARDPRNTRIVNYHPSNFWLCGPETYLKQEYYGEPRPKEYSTEGVNRVIREANAHGFIVSYNHPVWSCENYEQYTAYKGLFALEIYNYGSDLTSGMDYVPLVYDDMLRANGRLFAISGDDNHNKKGSDRDSFGAVTMIKAEKLDYDLIISALEKGDMYTKMRYSPELMSLYVEDGKAYVDCGPAKHIYMRTGSRTCIGYHADGDEVLTHAEFDVAPDDTYIRFELVGSDGSRTATNAYFIEDII